MKRTLYLALLLIGTLFIAACAEISNALPNSGRLYIQIDGLPTDARAGIIVTGPADYEKEVDKETTLTELEEGRYKVVTQAVIFGGETYTPDKELERPDVKRNETAEVAIRYSK